MGRDRSDARGKTAIVPPEVSPEPETLAALRFRSEEARYDGRGYPYFWIAFARGVTPTGRHGTDLSALADQRISVTPLRLDLTDEPFMTKLAEMFSQE